MSKPRAEHPLGRRSPPAGPGFAREAFATAATVGVVAAGVALFEVALIPGILIGGAAVLAPKLLARALPGLRAQAASSRRPNASRPVASEIIAPIRRGVPGPAAAASRFPLRLAIAKTVTFRVVVTSLDFTVNYIVLGSFASAAGLSAFGLVAGPVFYFLHEAAWARAGTSGQGEASRWRISLLPPVLAPLPPGAEPMPGVTISRALAKTITFRTLATAIEFTANYVVAGDVVTAVVLSSLGVVVGPFIYLAHERAWDRFGPRFEAAFADDASSGRDPSPPLLAAPQGA